ncbi:radical SAM protein [Cryptosporangium arvum]|uniref:radical SAM protein n=1 Tax=Cryptosporangium arvum TaxID=80871 RepID=UPI000A060753|nr:radical SAM protein [Cryptosporangium arvum]
MNSTDPYRKFRVQNFPQTNLSNYLPVDGVEVKLLDGCNRSCIFCVNEDHIGKRLNPIDTERFVRSVIEWSESPDEPEKPEAIYGTGGEPLMAMDLVEEVFGPLASRGLTTRLVTNGTLLTRDRIARLTAIGLTGVKVTYNTMQEDRLMALMKGAKPNDTKQLLENIGKAKEAGLWVFVRIGMGQHNADEAAAIYRVMRDLGVDVVQIKPWIPSGYAAQAQNELSLRPSALYDRFADIMMELYEELDTGGPELTTSCYPPARQLEFTVKDCANVAKIYCEPGGEALVCNFADEYLGNWYPEEGGLLGVVARRRELYPRMMDDHGVASCPARLNWSTPGPVVSPAPQWKPERPLIPLEAVRVRTAD